MYGTTLQRQRITATEPGRRVRASALSATDYATMHLQGDVGYAWLAWLRSRGLDTADVTNEDVWYGLVNEWQDASEPGYERGREMHTARSTREQGGWSPSAATTGFDRYPGLDNVQAQAATISSGTIAALTGFTQYTDLDRIQGQFVQFVQGKEGQYRNWIHAWSDFAQIHSSEWPNPKPVTAALRLPHGVQSHTAARHRREAEDKKDVGLDQFTKQFKLSDDKAKQFKAWLEEKGEDVESAQPFGKWMGLYQKFGAKDEKKEEAGRTREQLTPVPTRWEDYGGYRIAVDYSPRGGRDWYASVYTMSGRGVAETEPARSSEEALEMGKMLIDARELDEARRTREQGWTYTRPQADYKGYRIEWVGQSVMIYDNSHAVWKFLQSGDVAQDEADAKSWIDQRLAGRAARRPVGRFMGGIDPGWYSKNFSSLADIRPGMMIMVGQQLMVVTGVEPPNKLVAHFRSDPGGPKHEVYLSDVEEVLDVIGETMSVREQGDPEPSGTIAPVSPELERGDPAVIELPPDAAALPEEAQVLWLETYVSYLDGGEEPAVHQAWTAVYDAGWSQDDTGQWYREEIVAPVVDDATGGVEDIVMMPEAHRRVREAEMTPREWADRGTPLSPDIKQKFFAWLKAQHGISIDQVVDMDDLPWYWSEFERTDNILVGRESQVMFGRGVVKYQTTLATVLQVTDDSLGNPTTIGRSEWFNTAEAEAHARQQSMTYPAPQRFLVYDGDDNMVSAWQGGAKMSTFTIASRRAFREAQEGDVRPLTPQEEAAYPGMLSPTVALFTGGQWVYAEGELPPGESVTGEDYYFPVEVMSVLDAEGNNIPVRESAHRRIAARRPVREMGAMGFEEWREQVRQVALRQGVSPDEIARKLSEQELVFWSWYDRGESPEAAAVELMPTLHARRVPIREKKTHTAAWHRCVEEVKRTGGGKYNPYAVCTWSIDRPGGEDVYKGSRRARETGDSPITLGEYAGGMSPDLGISLDERDEFVRWVNARNLGGEVLDRLQWALLFDEYRHTMLHGSLRAREAILTLTLEDARKADDILAEEMEMAGVQALKIDTDTWEITEVPAGEVPVKEPPPVEEPPKPEEEEEKEARRDWVRPTSRHRPVREAGMTMDEFFKDDPDRGLIQKPFEAWLSSASGWYEKGTSMTEDEWAKLLTDYEEQVGQEMAARRAREQDEGEDEESEPKEITIQVFADEKDISEDDLATFKSWLADNEKEAGSQPVENWQKLYDQFGKAGGEEDEGATEAALAGLELAARQAIREESAYLAEAVDRRLVTGMGGFSDSSVGSEISDTEFKEAFRDLLPDLDDDQLESVVNGRD